MHLDFSLQNIFANGKWTHKVKVLCERFVHVAFCLFPCLVFYAEFFSGPADALHAVSVLSNLKSDGMGFFKKLFKCFWAKMTENWSKFWFYMFFEKMMH